MREISQYDELDFDCPVCDKTLISEEEGTHELCEHVLFVYLDSIGEFESSTDEIDTLVEKIRKEKSDPDGGYYDGEIMEDLLEALPDNITIHQLTGYGMACGPTSFTISVGIKE